MPVGDLTIGKALGRGPPGREHSDFHDVVVAKDRAEIEEGQDEPAIEDLEGNLAPLFVGIIGTIEDAGDRAREADRDQHAGRVRDISVRDAPAGELVTAGGRPESRVTAGGSTVGVGDVLRRAPGSRVPVAAAGFSARRSGCLGFDKRGEKQT